MDKGLGNANADINKKLEEESIKYFMWLDAERSALFFARHVIICEGATEKVFINHILEDRFNSFKENNIYFLDAMGKFNICRYMNLFKYMGIYHSVLMDSDEDKDIHKLINEFICLNKNPFTKRIYAFDNDFEVFLGIPRAIRKDLKPLHVMDCYKRKIISDQKIDKLFEIISSLC